MHSLIVFFYIFPIVNTLKRQSNSTSKILKYTIIIASILRHFAPYHKCSLYSIYIRSKTNLLKKATQFIHFLTHWIQRTCSVCINLDTARLPPGATRPASRLIGAGPFKSTPPTIPGGSVGVMCFLGTEWWTLGSCYVWWTECRRVIV